MTIPLKVCVHATEIDGAPFTNTDLSALIDEGMQDLRFYGFDKEDFSTIKRYLLMRFELADMEAIGNIKSTLDTFKAVYCFVDSCPRSTYACPAYRPAGG